MFYCPFNLQNEVWLKVKERQGLSANEIRPTFNHIRPLYTYSGDHCSVKIIKSSLKILKLNKLIKSYTRGSVVMVGTKLKFK